MERKIDTDILLAKHLCNDPDITKLLYEKFKFSGDKNDLITENKDSLVDAINEIADSISDIETLLATI